MANLFIKKDLKSLIAEANPNFDRATVGTLSGPLPKAASKVLRKKTLGSVSDADAKGAVQGVSNLKRSLTAFNLVMIGIGAIVGAGIFSLTGTAAAYYAGPAIVYSFMIGGILCAFSGLCYAEMAAMVPVAGSAYTYSYATLGEFAAWIIGWDLVLEYAFGAVTVSASWSGYFFSLISKTLGFQIGDEFIRFTKGPWELVTLASGTEVFGLWNLPASVVAAVMALVLCRGIHESATFNNLIVLLKVSIILSFIALGWGVIDPTHWIGNPAATGFGRLVPPQSLAMRNGNPFLSFGWPGVLTGAGVVFFSYIGFDAVSTTAQECKNPSRDLPIGILGSLVVCTILYILMALVITGVVPFQELGVPDPVAVGVDKIVVLRGWSIAVQKTIGFVVKVGALAGLTSVILVMMLGQTRIFFAMAKDGLLPWFDQLNRHSSPYIAAITTGAFVSICAGLMPMSLVGELVSIGTLLAFVLVCVGIPILRYKHPNIHRPFKTPYYWIVAPAGALSCFWVMTGLPRDTWIRLLVWLVLGFIIYFSYGIKHSKLRNEK